MPNELIRILIIHINIFVLFFILETVFYMDISMGFLTIKAVLTMHAWGGRIDDSQYGNWQHLTKENEQKKKKWYNHVSN